MKTAILLALFIAQVLALDLQKLVPPHNLDLFEGKDYAEQPELHITGGDIATRGQFPWTTLINIDSSYVCGGSLISDQWVLTAAECTYGYGLFQIYIGMQNWQNDEEGRIITVTTNRIVHESYDYSYYLNDIALIKLNIKVAFNEFIQPVTLPTYSMASQDFAGESVTALGWGVTSDNDTSISPDLRFVKLTVITNEFCKDSWGSYILKSNLCTDAREKKSTCSGDNGGPLVTADNVLIGIQSFVASDGCEKGLSSVFTRVTHYLEWIEVSSGVTINQ